MNDPILPQADPPPGLCTGEDERDGGASHADNRARMDPEERKNMILDGAIAFFAKHGFKAQTRELARHLGVSQSLIYHYFSTKEQLIERIYERTCPTQLRNRWHATLTDRNVPIKMRLKAFYAHYLGATDNSNRIRIIMFAGLDGSLFARRHLETQVHGLLRQIAIEIAVEYAAAPDNYEPSAADVELVWHLHSTFVYFLVRKSIFRLQVITDTDQLIDMTVDNFIAGIAWRYSPAPAIVPHESSRAG